ncbi:MAG: glycerol acyltransferase [Gammaproteobacteria bacterium]|jgi:1-acyl-sn-glycerol-3-phosphate acyltransferase|nr:glycerol acyltransferase [Gammaproteobacteria bacterium]MBT4491629.1 glycerol acyltransferase [Gammaproteobacteria bacterium]MBT7369173.1 glycerol acyltransferase [Gammaproteobacteria bacterium]
MSDFEDIRPYHDDEVSDVLNQLVRDPELTGFLATWLAPRLSKLFPVGSLISFFLQRKIRGVSDIRGFQNVIANYARKLVRDGTTKFVYEGFEKLKPNEAYLFVSNHRDIAGDSMLLDYALYLSGLETVRIAIGDNLVQREFATSLMRLNKGFFIKRSAGGPRKVYAALMQSSQFIRHSLDDGHSIWIAQSEGRSKDGFDVTDPAVVKMLVLSDRKKPLTETVHKLRIVPLSISYEFDPCDVLKATELGKIDLEGGYEKPPGEDLMSLVRGLGGQKGRVIFRLGKELKSEYETPEQVAAEIDREIISNLELFPVNYWAVSKLNEPEYRELLADSNFEISKKEALALTNRLKQCPPAYRRYWLKAYANPVLNRKRVLNQ